MTLNISIAILIFHFFHLSFGLSGTEVMTNSQKLSKADFEWNDRARPDQKSLLIVFDTTGSMSRDLNQLKNGAKDIVKAFSAKTNDPIFNYVLSLFNDPIVEDPFITQDPEVLLERLNLITVAGGGDCPEMSIRGLINAVENALPNSQAFLFSDASAKDYLLFDHVAALIQRKQTSVNFMLTGDCDGPNEPGFKVYEKIARVGGGQVFNMQRDNVRDVLVALSVSLESDFVTFRSIDSDEAGTSLTTLELDETIKRVSVSLSGRNAQLSIKNSANNRVVSNETFSSENIQIVTFDVTDSKYLIEASAKSAFSLRVGGISSLKFEFGFSRQEPKKQSETYIRPLSGQQNVLSIFVSDFSLIKSLETAKILPASTLDSFDEFEMELKLNNGFFSTNLFEIPKQMFRIQIFGTDNGGNVIERVISTGIESISTMVPEVEIDYNSLSTEIGGKITLNCIVKSLTTVNMTWTIEDTILARTTSDQSSNLLLSINNFRQSNVGNYSCSAVNEIGKDEQQVTLNLKPTCKSECPFEGFAVIPSYRDCTLYYICVKGIQYARECPSGEIFDSATLACGDPKTSVCASKAPCKS